MKLVFSSERNIENLEEANGVAKGKLAPEIESRFRRMLHAVVESRHEHSNTKRSLYSICMNNRKNKHALHKNKKTPEDSLTYDEYNSNIQQSFSIGFRDAVVQKRYKLFGDNRLFVSWSFRFFIFVFLLLFLPSS